MRKFTINKAIASFLGLFLVFSMLVVLAAYVYRAPIYRYGPFVLLFPPMSPVALGDGGPASELTLFHPGGIARDSEGTLYISDRGEVDTGRPLQGSVIWKIDEAGIAHAIAGTGRQGEPPGRVPALEADLKSVETMVFDDQGRMLFVDHKHGIVSRIEPDGMLTRIAGSGEKGYSGDGGPALEATFRQPFDIARDTEGNLYIADAQNHAIRVITPDGLIDTFAGTGTPGYSGDGGPAKQAQLNWPYDVDLDPKGGLLIGDSGNQVVRRVDENGIITTVVGSGQTGYAGDGGDAVEAKLHSPEYVQMVGDQLFVGDELNHAIRRVDADGTIYTVIGNGEPGLSPSGTLASNAQLSDPEGFLVDPDGTMFVLDSRNHRVLWIDKQKRIWRFAGRGRETDGLECARRIWRRCWPFF